MEQKVMKYPIGIQQFEELRRKDFVYVDKTEYIYQLASTGKYYFLSRPRRFGKSLLISTMEAYFEGKRELFKGLAMESLETEWLEYPVLHLDLNPGDYENEGELEKTLKDSLDEWDQKFEISTAGDTIPLRFKKIISTVSRKFDRQVVILIDEYDKPLLATIDNPERNDQYRRLLKAFYGNLKTMDGYIKFAFLTGVTKFGKVSVFSDLNNLEDISMQPQYNGICGITEAELHQYLDEGIKKLSLTLNKTFDETCETMCERYDGYHFVAGGVGIYNPFSVLNTLKSCVLSDYWFATGTPTFLIDLLKENNYSLANLEHVEMSPSKLSSIDIIHKNPIPVLYQSGYLTIKGVDDLGDYILGYPNREVERGFTESLLYAFTPDLDDKFSPNAFVRDVRAGKVEQFMKRLESFFAGGNYQIVGDAEKYFQNCLFLIFKMMGYHTHTEYPTSDGRTDILVETPDYIYIIEVKLDKSAEEAMQQIEDKQYAAPYAMDPRRLYKIGINFSTTTRKVDGWIVK